MVSPVLASDQVPSAVLGRYTLQDDKYWIVRNQTIQQLSDEGYDIEGAPDQLLYVNYTRLNYTLKSKIVELDWPNVTCAITEGEYDLNVTAYMILENESIGERVGSFLRENQPSFTRQVDSWDPNLMVGWNPSLFDVGNSFSFRGTEYTVNRTEVLSIQWGKNQTYVLCSEGTIDTFSYKSIHWCDAETGIFLKGIVDTESPTFISHEELQIIETGIEEVMDQLPPLSVGDRWVYSYDYSDRGITGTITEKVIGESIVTVDDVEYDCYKSELMVQGQFSYQGETGTWTNNIMEYTQKSDLSLVKYDSTYTRVTTQPESHTYVTITNYIYKTPIKQFDLPLTSGKVWSINATETKITKSISDGIESSETTDVNEISLLYYCLRTETTTVTAGTFDTFVIEYYYPDLSYRVFYYSQEVGYIIKQLTYDADNNLLESFELIEYAIHQEVIDYTQFIILAVAIIVISSVTVIYFVKKKKTISFSRL